MKRTREFRGFSGRWPGVAGGCAGGVSRGLVVRRREKFSSAGMVG